MSYINDALRKAQRERDGRYERFGGIIAPNPDRPGQPRKRRFAIGIAVMLFVLIPTGVLLAVYILHQPSPAAGGIPKSVVAGTPAAPRSANQQTVRESTEGNTIPAAGLAPGEIPVTVQAGRQPIPVVTDAAPGGTPSLREAEMRYQEALSAQRSGDARGAEAIYKKVLALDPNHVRALNNLGVVCMSQKKREMAIALFTKAIVLKRDYVDPYYNLACLYAQTNEIDESLWYLKVAMTINGDVKNWVRKDADMRNITASPEFKKIMEGQKN